MSEIARQLEKYGRGMARRGERPPEGPSDEDNCRLYNVKATRLRAYYEEKQKIDEKMWPSSFSGI